jgi:signal peptidase I
MEDASALPSSNLQTGVPLPTPKVVDADEHPTNAKDTIESILVAFILAFIFRAFVVEAFVIPTGSMAPTLLGAHFRFTCPDCGYVFDVNYPEKSPDDLSIPPNSWPAADVYCPNCGYLITRPPPEGQAVPVHYGDRILVLKYIYLLHDPKRWDVVVFKAPPDPDKYHYSVNYIKRLVGKPGESLMVLDGNIYISPSAQNPNWQIQTKPRDVQEALWRIVYDNDFYPQTIKRNGQADWVQPWQSDAGAGWNLGASAADGRSFHFANTTGSGEIHFNPTVNQTTQTLTDYLVYDLGANFRRPNEPDDERANPVSDVKLVTQYHRTAGDGPLDLRLTRYESLKHVFTAEITATTARLLHNTNNGQTQVGQTVNLASVGIDGNKPIFIEFQNVDYQVTLRLNGKDILQTTPNDYAPNVPWLIQEYRNHKHDDHSFGQPAEIAVEANNQSCDLDHTSLWRDVYYTNRDPYNQIKWGTPDTPVTLGNDEFFVMGDNSAISGDARYWTDPVNLPSEALDVQPGRVPGRFMLGQAVFVYWPAGYRAFDTSLAIIPNFGDMRWIH